MINFNFLALSRICLSSKINLELKSYITSI
nr:MAG TPA: hypothetical protein [Caudoviricetes sp.]